MKPPLRRGLTFAGGVLLAILAITVIAVTGFLVRQQGKDQAWVEHSLGVQVGLARISALLQDAETAQRGYMITDRQRFFDEYHKAADNVPKALDGMAVTVADNEKQLGNLSNVRDLAKTRLDFLGQAVGLQKDGKLADAVALIKTGRGKILMDQGTDALKGMADEEQRLLEERRNVSQQTGFWTQGAIALSMIIAVAIIVMLARDARARYASLAETNAALQGALDRADNEARRREAAESQFRQAQKMEAVGQLTGGIAHDFNNMLAIIIGSLDMAKRRLARGDQGVEKSIDSAADGAQRAATLTQRMLAFSRQQPLQPAVTDTNALISDLAELLRRTIGEEVSLETVQAGGLWRTNVDGAQLEQAVLNLAVNARDAMPNGGKLTIETFNASLDDAYAEHHPDVPAGQYVVVAVSDNGCGMAKDVVARAFDPFFTTKIVGKGTGLGLSQVFGFVKQSGGHLKIYSEEGLGTTVKIYLPRYHGEDAPRSAAADTVTGQTPSGAPHEIILVVEDEERVRHVAVDALRELGYTVLHADNGSNALALVEQHEGIRLLFTDVVMPAMNGQQLAKAAREKRPALKVLYTTGYTRNAIVHNGRLDYDATLLAKPFTVSQLATKVRKMMDQDFGPTS